MLIQAETAMKKKAAIPATLKKLPTKALKMLYLTEAAIFSTVV